MTTHSHDVIRYDHYDLRQIAADQPNDPMWSEPALVVRSKFHGGGILSRHRTVRAAWRALKAYTRDGCTCGCAGIIAPGDYDRLPTVDDAWRASDLARG